MDHLQPLRRGVSLVETVIAIFILSSCVLVIVGMFQAALWNARRSQTLQLAVLVAEKNIEDLRSQAGANTTSVYGFDTWSTTPPLTTAAPDPDYPDFQVRAQLVATTLYSPCSSSELALHPTDLRALRTSAFKVKITVSWGVSESVSLTSLIGDPVRAMGPLTVGLTTVQVSGAGPILAQAGSQGFNATVVDALNHPIHDPLLQWNLVPGSAGATLQQRRDGSQATLTNLLVLPSQPPVFSGGNVSVMARGRFFGYQKVGNSTLQGMSP